jgi:integrase
VRWEVLGGIYREEVDAARRGLSKPGNFLEVEDSQKSAVGIVVESGRTGDRERLQNLVQFGLWTGLRLSELFALNWGNVDWINDRIYVEGALTQDAEEIEDTKTEAGERTVNLLPPALAALKAKKERTFLKGLEISQNPHTRERWTGDHALRARQWNTLCRRAGVRYRPPGQIRHTFASMSLKAGESPQWVAAQMGHTDWTFTARVYYRWIPRDAGDAGDRVMKKWGRN